MKREDDKISRLLDRWEPEFKPDDGLSSRVHAALGQRSEPRSENERLASWFGNAFSRPGLVASFAAVFMLMGVGLSQLLSGGFSGEKEGLTLSYRLSIDPLYRLQAMAGAEQFANHPIMPARNTGQTVPVLLAGLGWLQGELDLSELQYQQVSALHGDYETGFDELFGQLLESHRDYRAFDRQRMNSDVIDYFQFYELLQKQKELSERSARLTRELLSKVEKVIEPDQRHRYRELLDEVYPGFMGDDNSKTDA